MSIEEEMKQAEHYYKTLTDPSYLLGCEVEPETYKYLLCEFVLSDLSKKDLTILVHLMDGYLKWDTQLFTFKYEDLEVFATKSNISRTMKKLVEGRLIDKISIEKSKHQHYFFRAQYDLMKTRI